MSLPRAALLTRFSIFLRFKVGEQLQARHLPLYSPYICDGQTWMIVEFVVAATLAPQNSRRARLARGGLEASHCGAEVSFRREVLAPLYNPAAPLPCCSTTRNSALEPRLRLPCRVAEDLLSHRMQMLEQHWQRCVVDSRIDCHSARWKLLHDRLSPYASRRN